MRYCRTCVLPDTRPNLRFNLDGSCNCKFGNFRVVDFDAEVRKAEFLKLIRENRRDSEFDCVIPVSGGKDSTWQTLRCLELGLRPLCVTWKTPGRNSLGLMNLENLISLGVDHFDVSVNPEVDKLIVRHAFEVYGSPALPMHRLIRSIPIRIAKYFNIPIVLDGENSAIEYGGELEDFTFYMTNQWLKKYGVVGEIDINVLAESFPDRRSLFWYETPDLDKERSQGFFVIFASYFFPWSPQIAFDEARKHGFIPAIESKVGSWEYADLDDDFIIPIHHWMKWFKFGFTRRWDNLSIDIRNGRITREEAIDFLQSEPEREPVESIELFLQYVGMSRSEFDAICDKFRNPEIWQKQSSGRWELKSNLRNI